MLKYVKSAAVALFGALAFVAAAPSFAALDPSVATGLTGIQTDATSLNALIVPVVIAILGMLIVVKLIKRFGNKI